MNNPTPCKQSSWQRKDMTLLLVQTCCMTWLAMLLCGSPWSSLQR